MKIVTYNVNGLRQRVNQYGSLRRLLDSLDADIICIQETKLTRQQLSVDLTMAEGYEAFVSCNRGSSKGRTGYSGVATFCRIKSAFSSSEVALPIAAEEGFTGLLECSAKGESTIRDCMPFKLKGLEDITNKDLLKVDSEGRCIITDHGHFVLFNLYGPRAEDDDKERVHFKLVFFKMLQNRWESLLSQGKRIIVAGDLNIAPFAIDRCDAEPGFERNMFRAWLRSLLTNSGGPFFDAFRSKHPARREAYTCFSSEIGGEEFNYGSRIDHILIGGPCLHENHGLQGHDFLDCHLEECDIMIQFKRGNLENTPKWKGGRTIKLEGSDHIPVYAMLRDVPDLPLHDTPPLSVRYIPEVRGWQQTIVSFLGKKEVPVHVKAPGMFGSLSNENTGVKGSAECLVSSQDCGETSRTLKKKARCSTYSQLTLMSFFQQPKALSASKDAITIDTPRTQTDSKKGHADLSHAAEKACDKNLVENIEESSSELNEPSTNPYNYEQGGSNLLISSKTVKDNIAVLEWQKIHEKMRMSLPLCKGHGEPCVARSVKEGPNRGRSFYCCARAKEWSFQLFVITFSLGLSSVFVWVFGSFQLFHGCSILGELPSSETRHRDVLNWERWHLSMPSLLDHKPPTGVWFILGATGTGFCFSCSSSWRGTRFFG